MKTLYFWSSRIAWGAFALVLVSVFLEYAIAHYWHLDEVVCESFAELPIQPLFVALQAVGIVSIFLAMIFGFLCLSKPAFLSAEKLEAKGLGILLAVGFFVAFYGWRIPMFLFVFPFLLLYAPDPCFDID